MYTIKSVQKGKSGHIYISREGGKGSMFSDIHEKPLWRMSCVSNILLKEKSLCFMSYNCDGSVCGEGSF